MASNALRWFPHKEL